MHRYLLENLKIWLNSPSRKPLVLRGARQVGKTWLVRELACLSEKKLIELNFEQKRELAAHFACNEPKTILLNLQSALNLSIDSKTCILFLDEIQAAPELLAKLRWFYESMPELPVIATGSLLEFVLNQHEFSMPVGRIQYCFVEPLNFKEFLQAKNELHLLSAIEQVTPESPFNQALHQKANHLFKEYLLVGGMPEAANIWIQTSSMDALYEIHHHLINTYKDDFSKYAGKIDITYLQDVIKALPSMISQKLMYQKINASARHETIKRAVDLLIEARLCHKVCAVSANGIPLAAEIKPKMMKLILVDVGLVSALLGLRAFQHSLDDVVLINSGALAEQIVGQLLRTLTPHYIDPCLYYWTREEQTSTAEVDYIIQTNATLIPIEVKAGSAGKLRSLHQFVSEKPWKKAVRVYAGELSLTQINTKTANGNLASYSLLSLPFYLVSELHRLLNH